MAKPDATRRVIAQQCHRVYTLAYYTLGAHQDAEDATQEVLVRYWKHADRIDADRVEGWLVRVTRNVCLDQLRRRRASRESCATEAAETALAVAAGAEQEPHASAETNEATTVVREELTRLSEPYRSLLVLRELRGLSYRAIAEAVEMPLSSVRVYLHRGRRQLADRLRQRGATAPPTPPAPTTLSSPTTPSSTTSEPREACVNDT